MEHFVLTPTPYTQLLEDVRAIVRKELVHCFDTGISNAGGELATALFTDSYRTAAALMISLLADTWYTPEQAFRRLKILAKVNDPVAVLSDAHRRGWLTYDPTGALAYDSRIWPLGEKAPTFGPVLLAVTTPFLELNLRKLASYETYL